MKTLHIALCWLLAAMLLGASHTSAKAPCVDRDWPLHVKAAGTLAVDLKNLANPHTIGADRARDAASWALTFSQAHRALLVYAFALCQADVLLAQSPDGDVKAAVERLSLYGLQGVLSLDFNSILRRIAEQSNGPDCAKLFESLHGGSLLLQSAQDTLANNDHKQIDFNILRAWADYAHVAKADSDVRTIHNKVSSILSGCKTRKQYRTLTQTVIIIHYAQGMADICYFINDIEKHASADPSISRTAVADLRDDRAKLCDEIKRCIAVYGDMLAKRPDPKTAAVISQSQALLRHQWKQLCRAPR